MTPTPVRLQLLRPGEMVGPFEIIGHLATGGMGEVYLSRKRGLGGFERTVVLKVMLQHLARDSHFARMFMDEARIASALSHPNIVQVFDLDRSESGELYLAMEHLQGQSVAACLKHTAKSKHMIPQEVVGRILCDAATGLTYAHAATDAQGEDLGLVHRDISPENLFLTYAGPTKVLDFGVAKVKGRLAKTQHGEFKGKVGYMAPEIIKGEEVDARSDLFSLGVMAFEMLTTRRLYHTDNPATALHLVLTSPVPDVRQVREDVDDELAEICSGLARRKRKKRLQSAEEVAERLEAWLLQRGGTSKFAGQWLKETFPDAHEASAKIAEAVARTGRIDVEDLARARALGGEDLDDTWVRGFSPDERREIGGSTLSRPYATDPGGYVEWDESHADTGWIVRARLGRWIIGALFLFAIGFGASRLIREAMKQETSGWERLETVHESTNGSLYKVKREGADQLGLMRVLKLQAMPDDVHNSMGVAETRVRKLNHNRLDPVLDHGVLGSRVYTVTAWREGYTLRDMLDKEFVTPEKARYLIREICGVFAAAGHVKLVHGAFDPNVVFISKSEIKILGWQAGFSAPGQLAASPYRAPELKAGELNGPWVDQYAVGVLVQEILRGSDQPAAVAAAPIIARATAVDPIARYPNIEALNKTLQEVLNPKPKRRKR